MSDVQKPLYSLPPALMTRVDLARLTREVEDLDNALEAQKARNRSTGETGYHLPGLSRALDDFVELNKIDIADDQSRMTLRENLRLLKDHAPVLHLTFAAQADTEALGQLVAWLRQEIHPQTILSVGLQPALVGGVYVRTPNHVHDYSLRSLLQSKHSIMVDELKRYQGAA